MIILAHDGSVYGDWVARYALHFTRQEEDRKLLVLHVPENKVRLEIVTSRFAQLAEECRRLEIECRTEILTFAKPVYRTLRHAIPHDPEALLICGTRVKPNRRAFLRGSVAEMLLRMRQCPVLALRVVQPGLLGQPHELLLPLAGHENGFARACPVLQRLVPQLARVHLFRALPVHTLLLPHLTPSRERKLLGIGRRHLENFAQAMSRRLDCSSLRVEQRVAISASWPDDILLQANRLRAQMVLLGVSERSLAHRVLHGDGIERILLQSPCDVGIYRGP